MSTQKLITQEESLHDSWVELHFDSSSEHSEGTPTLCDITDLEKMLLEAQRESCSSSRTSSHCSSPRRVQTPPLIGPASFNTHINVQEEVVREIKQEAESVMSICDWSSRPENVPPAAFLIKRPKRNRVSSRNTNKTDEEMNTHLLKLLLPSLVLTHILMLGLGICIGRRLTTQCSAIWVIGNMFVYAVSGSLWHRPKNAPTTFLWHHLFSWENSGCCKQTLWKYDEREKFSAIIFFLWISCRGDFWHRIYVRFLSCRYY